MRKLNYEVVTKNGHKFNTTNYNKAIKDDRHISKIFLTDVVEEKTDKQIAKIKKRIAKIYSKYGIAK